MIYGGNKRRIGNRRRERFLGEQGIVSFEKSLKSKT